MSGSAKSIMHYLFNLALYKSPFSHTANSQFIVKPYTVRNEDWMSNIKLRTVAKFTSSPPSIGFISLHHVPAQQPSFGLIFICIIDRSTSPAPKEHELRNMFALWFWNPEFQLVPVTLGGWWGFYRSTNNRVMITMTTTISIFPIRWQHLCKDFIDIILFNPDNTLWRCYFHHFTVEEAEIWDVKQLVQGYKVSVCRVGILAPQRCLINDRSDPFSLFS